MLLALLVAASLALPLTAQAQSLRGSHASLVRQQQWAKIHDFTFLRTPAEVRRFARKGLLVRLSGDRNYEVAGVSFPYARPEARLFVERLAAQYRSACGEKLVVTSATRPLTRQPRNASRLSTHPTGMALDFRRSRLWACRSWLERTLLDLEAAGLLEATRERYPPHYHVAVFPKPYVRYVAGLTRGSEQMADSPAEDSQIAEVAEENVRTYSVRRGDSLWSIARRNGVTVRELKRANDLSTSRIRPGKTLVIPTSSG